MKRTYINPITEIQVCMQTSVLCASGDLTAPVNTNPIDDTIIY